MALIVEDGTSKTDAESYASLTFINTYLASVGRDSTWLTKTTAEQEEFTRQGTEFLEYAFAESWSGTRSTEDQRLSWPRVDVIDKDGFDVAADSVPLGVQEATALAAELAASGEDLLSALTRSDFTTSQTVGPLSVSFQPNAPAAKIYRRILGRIGRYLTISTTSTGSFATVAISRA